LKKVKLPRKLRIPLIYCVFSIAWIVLSDRITLVVAHNLESATRIGIIKGSAFVIISTLLIFLLLAFDERKETSLANELSGAKDGFIKLYDNNPQPMLISDPELLNIITANESALNLFGYNRDEFLSLKLTDLVLLEESDLVKLNLQNDQDAFRRTGPWRLRTKKGLILYSYMVMSNIDFSGKIADMIAVIDITEQKEIESALKKTESERDNFEAFGFSLSHDLRSSLRTISGYSQILTEDYGNKMDAKGLEYLEHMRQASQSMNNMIDSLLMLTGITHRNLSVDITNLGTIASRVAEQLRTQEPNRQVQFNIQSEVIARCDSDLMRMALYDLMENSWKYTSKVSSAVIEFGLTVAENGERIFFVRDNGVGFDQSKASEIFKPFQRLHSTTEFKGSGVGLSVVSRIIERHQGRIWAEGEVGKGATFYFTLGLDEEKINS
jgi:PAS domain S-box-containing protein